MSTSTEETRAEPVGVSVNQAPPRWRQRNLSPSRGLAYLALVVLLILATAINAHATWGFVGHIVILGLEVAEELFDTLLEVVGITPGAAQMVTAYTGLSLFFGLLYFLGRRAPRWGFSIRETFLDYLDMYADLLRSAWFNARTEAVVWWEGLDWPARIGAAAFAILVLIPLLAAVLVGLGMLVTALLF